ncbi:MAG: ABC transporter substrate-binding protein [Deltaproteobacteria bacterium]|nr:ABC transporter substrate-binding protein [Deltaproteobacteria bacterium]
MAAMMSSDQPRYREAHLAFVKSLAARGYTSANTEIILQSPNPDPHSWSNTVRKFNAYRPDLIVAYGAPAALVAMKESEGIPVVAADMYAPEKPPRGMCGVSSRVPLLMLFNIFQELRHHRRIGALYTAREAGSQRQLEEFRKLALQFGMSVEGANVASAPAVEAALDSMLDKVDVIVATESGIVCRQFDRIISRARARNIPVVATMPGAAERGALLSLEISPQEQGHLAAEIASRILEGARAEHLSLLSPRRVDLIINLRVAREMGITMPFAALGAATRVIK